MPRKKSIPATIRGWPPPRKRRPALPVTEFRPTGRVSFRIAIAAGPGRVIGFPTPRHHGTDSGAAMLSFVNRHLVQPLAAWKAGSFHLKHLRALERSQFDPPDVVRDRQLAAVRDVVRHAWDTVPYYRERWAAAGAAPGRRALARRPAPVPGPDQGRHPGPRRPAPSAAFRDRPVTLKTTSGSTGVPLTIAVDDEAMAWKRAMTVRSDQWSGWRLGPARSPGCGAGRRVPAPGASGSAAAASSTARVT